MKGFTKHVIYHGSPDALPERVALRAGPVSLFFEAGDLRYLRVGNREFIRRIYAAVRDRNWGTVPAKVSNLDLVNRPDSFRIFYEAEHKQGDIHFTWRAEIVGEASGRIVFTMDGKAGSTFLKNRIGICVLHPIHECAGAKCRMERSDGAVATSHFPWLVAPEQPLEDVHDLAAFAHEDVPGRWIGLKFSGEVFEMEDQRNWIDASYKTYCTPLRLPYPVEVKAGYRMLQQVMLEITGTLPDQLDQSSVTEIEVDTTALRNLPKLGLGASSFKEPLSVNAKARLTALRLAHLRCELRLASPDWKQEFLRARDEAKELGVGLELALVLPREGNVSWPEVRLMLQEARRTIVRFLVFADGENTTSARTLGLARQHLTDFRVPLGAGTDADFYQLNQARPTHPAADFIVWSMNPQVHACDLASMAETPEAMRAQLESAREYFPNKPLIISPVTLKPRFNPVVTGPEAAAPAGELPSQVDPRQMSLFGAAWTLAAFKALAEAGAGSVTFYETVGWRGIMESEGGPPLPQRFRSISKGVFPMYHVFADIGEFAGGQFLSGLSTQPLVVDVLALHQDGRIAVLLANLTPQRQAVRLGGISGTMRKRMLDETSAETAMRDPESFREKWGKGEMSFELPPFGYCRLDLDETKP